MTGTPLPDITSSVMAKVAEFMNKDANNHMKEIPKAIPNSNLEELVG